MNIQRSQVISLFQNLNGAKKLTYDLNQISTYEQEIYGILTKYLEEHPLDCEFLIYAAMVNVEGDFDYWEQTQGYLKRAALLEPHNLNIVLYHASIQLSEMDGEMPEELNSKLENFFTTSNNVDRAKICCVKSEMWQEEEQRKYMLNKSIELYPEFPKPYLSLSITQTDFDKARKLVQTGLSIVHNIYQSNVRSQYYDFNIQTYIDINITGKLMHKLTYNKYKDEFKL